MIQRIDHIGINVLDLEAAKVFFLDLGLELLGEMEMEGSLVDRVTALDNVHTRIAMLGVPGGGSNIELVQFHTPPAVEGGQTLPANALGIRHICLAVESIDDLVATVKAHGGELFSAIQEYEGIYRLCYVRGPEGIIVELAERIG